ncbi:MAG: TIGR02757 family protein [Muribaculaceae bacterium]|nr:TIGR02757 family protein [Muribaculaceae bacterium]
MVGNDIRELLDSEAARINNPGFIEKDPVQFPRRFEKIQDIEIVSFLAANLAWGNRKMICRDIEKMLSLMDNEPYQYMMEKGYEDLEPRLNIHRTFFAEHLQHFLRGFRKIYKDFGSLDNFAHSNNIGEEAAPAWKLVELINEIMLRENGGPSSRCLPLNLKQSALKRVNMALRWLVRDDGIVDLGVWNSIPKSKLYIPLDVHVGNVSRELGLLTRKANDRKSVEELTRVLRQLRPDDPAVYDFALFGIGVGE